MSVEKRTLSHIMYHIMRKQQMLTRSRKYDTQNKGKKLAKE